MIKSPCCQAKVEYVVRAMLSYSVDPKTGRIAKRRKPVIHEETDTGEQVTCTKCDKFYYADVEDGMVMMIEEEVND